MELRTRTFQLYRVTQVNKGKKKTVQKAYWFEKSLKAEFWMNCFDFWLRKSSKPEAMCHLLSFVQLKIWNEHFRRRAAVLHPVQLYACVKPVIFFGAVELLRRILRISCTYIFVLPPVRTYQGTWMWYKNDAKTKTLPPPFWIDAFFASYNSSWG